MLDSAEAQFAIAAVREAAQLTRRVQQEMLSPALVKGDKSPVTVADFSAQAIIAKRLSETLPDARLVGEEDAGDLHATDEGRKTLAQVQHFVATLAPGSTAEQVCQWIDRGNAKAEGTYWTLDPVDGTKGFLRGDQYAVALAPLKMAKCSWACSGVLNSTTASRPMSGARGRC